jgi:hypothetical protein
MTRPAARAAISIARTISHREREAAPAHRSASAFVVPRHDGRIAVDEPNRRWCSDGFEIACDNAGARRPSRSPWPRQCGRGSCPCESSCCPPCRLRRRCSRNFYTGWETVVQEPIDHRDLDQRHDAKKSVEPVMGRGRQPTVCESTGREFRDQYARARVRASWGYYSLELKTIDSCAK